MNLTHTHKPLMDVAFPIHDLNSKFLISTNNIPHVLSETHLLYNSTMWTKDLGFPNESTYD